MFISSYTATIDGKGRISIPSRYREILEEKYSNSLILSVSEDCLVGYPQSEWTAMEAKYRELSPLRKDVRVFFRLLYSRAAECEMKHGRILIPQPMRAQAGLGKEIIVAGVSRMFEIWDRGNWEKFMKGQEGQFDELGQRLSEI